MDHDDWSRLLSEAEALCRVYVGKDAESEEWRETCRRFETLDKICRKIRRRAKAQQAAHGPLPIRPNPGPGE